MKCTSMLKSILEVSGGGGKVDTRGSKIVSDCGWRHLLMISIIIILVSTLLSFGFREFIV